MSTFTWVTDIHLDHLTQDETERFLKEIDDAKPDGVFIGGDTSTAQRIENDLRMIGEKLQRPIYFVLGNHDFYGGSIAGIYEMVKQFSNGSEWLHWLPASGVVALTERTGLLGHGCFADGRLGRAEQSVIQFNDYFYIEEFVRVGLNQRYALMNELGEQAAANIRRTLSGAVRQYRSLYLLTHVPPFREACWHKGAITHDEFLPHLSCKAVGDVLIDIMSKHPDCSLTVLCGHTHGSGEVHILPNLRVITGGAVYGSPQLQALLEIE